MKIRLSFTAHNNLLCTPQKLKHKKSDNEKITNIPNTTTFHARTNNAH
jgi:hypothetical protein